MKTPTTREIFEAMHAAPKAPAPISGPVLGGGAVGVKSVLFERVKEAREAGKRLGLVERIKAGGEVSEGAPGRTVMRAGSLLHPGAVARSGTRGPRAPAFRRRFGGVAGARRRGPSPVLGSRKRAAST